MNDQQLKVFLDKKVDAYDQPFFIEQDPISIPHQFSGKQDREIAGLFAALFSWGNRTTIIQKSAELMARMGNQPYAFVREHSIRDLRNLAGFKHRTFTEDDLYYFLEILRFHYERDDSLESAFLQGSGAESLGMEERLDRFRQYFFQLEHLPRTRKHISSPHQKSTCKRLNMYLRWMVRKDHHGVDFGIWDRIQPSQLICPVDLHVARVARRLGLLTRQQVDWQAAVELTARLRNFDPDDPVKYDFALFGLGILERF